MSMLSSALESAKATRINLFSLATPQMRTFHLTWFAFFLCFFGWFGIAPLMAVVRDDLLLSKAQIGNTIIASVAITIIARLIFGWLCDRIGPRLAYSWLLAVGSIPVMCIGFSNSYETFLLFRLAIGVIGASFVITQYHTSVMFAPNVVGTANATTAGWGNLGGGVTQMVMPLFFTGVLMFGVGEVFGWRIAMVIPGAALLLVSIAYYFLTQDCPEGNYKDLRARGIMPPSSAVKGTFMEAAQDYRVWALFVIYGACFGVELTINNIAALYYYDHFQLNLATAGVIAGLYGVMNIFARTLGGVFGDRAGIKFGLKGRAMFLGIVLLGEGVTLILFSQMASLLLAVSAMMVFSLFVKMAQGATFSVVPFINRRALGSVAGIVGAGGNTGAVAFGFLFRSESLSTAGALFIVGIAVVLASGMVFAVRFSRETERAEQMVLNNALTIRSGMPSGAPAPAAAD